MIPLLGVFAAGERKSTHLKMRYKNGKKNQLKKREKRGGREGESVGVYVCHSLKKPGGPDRESRLHVNRVSYRLKKRTPRFK